MSVKKGPRFMVLLLIGAVFLCRTVDGAGPEAPEAGMTARFIPDAAPVGGMVDLCLVYRLPKGARLPDQPVVKGLDGLSMEGVENQAGEIRIRILVDRLGELKTGPLSLAYRGEDGKDGFLHADPAAMTVQSNLGERPEEAQIKPICGIIPTQTGLKGVFLWVVGGMGLLVAGILFVLWYRRRGAKERHPVVHVPPHIQAERALKELAAQEVFEKGQIKAFYFRFSEILRRYLESLRGFPAAEYTTQEIAVAVQAPEDREIVSLLRDADLVKFADLQPTGARKCDQLDQALAYVRRTGSLFDADHTDSGDQGRRFRFRGRPGGRDRETGL
jgi:hypothetical protein